MPSRCAAAMIALVRGYQRSLSWILPTRCRFYPSCSQYCIESLQQHGSWRGLGLSLWRLARCHPLGGKGYDPVPPAHPDAGATTDRDAPRTESAPP